MQLIDLGWDSFFEENFEPSKKLNLIPARISKENKLNYLAWCEQGELLCEISGKFRHEAASKSDFPTVGDWVAISARADEGRATIHSLLPRNSAFLRKTAGIETEGQVVAANINTVFIVCGLDNNFNLRRIERYLTLAWESGAIPVILLNKSDLCPSSSERLALVESIAMGVDIHILSATEKTGLEALDKYLKRGMTAAFLGSSGVGKSTIINSLLGNNRLKVGEVQDEDSRGRHTTSSREMIMLPDNGIVIDTPGMRELQLWGDSDGLKQSFEDIETLAANCRFRDCHHQKEPGCAVRIALDEGTLDNGRYQSYLKLKRELEYLAFKEKLKANSIEKLRWKKISMLIKNLKKES